MFKINSNYRIVGNFLEVIGSNGKEVFVIDEVLASGIKIQAQTEEGIDIIEYVSWSQIK